MSSNPVSERTLRAFILYVSSVEFKGDPEQLKEFISQNKLVETWWNYVPFVYCITSRSTASELTAAFVKFIGEYTDFIVSEINPWQTAGYITSGAWTSFNDDIRARLRPVDDEQSK